MLKPIRFLLLIISLYMACIVTSSASSLQELVKLLDSFHTLNGQFDQTTFKNHQTEHHHGTFAMAKPKQFRWQVQKPDNQLIVADGKDLWVYDEDLQQVTVQPLTSQLSDVPLLILSGDSQALASSYNLAAYRQQGQEAFFELRAKEETNLMRRITLSFNAKTITAMSLEDSTGVVTDMHFSRVQTNAAESTANFRFIPPAGVDVIGQP